MIEKNSSNQSGGWWSDRGLSALELVLIVAGLLVVAYLVPKVF